LLGDLPPGLYTGADVPHIRVPGNMPRGHKPRPKAERLVGSKRTYAEADDDDELPQHTLVITQEDNEEGSEEEEDGSDDDELDAILEQLPDDDDDDEGGDSKPVQEMDVENAEEEDEEDEEEDEEDAEESDEEDLLRMTNASQGEGDAEEEMIQVGFEFFDPKEEDYHGIKMFVQRFLDDRAFDSGGLADHVCTQTRVGTCVKGDDTQHDSIFGFVSVVNLKLHRKKTFVKQIIDCIVDECPDDKTKASVQKMLTDEKEQVGLLVCEKFANFPVELLGPLNRAISQEITWAQEDEPSEKLKKSYKFTKLIKVCCAFDGEQVVPQQSTKKKKKKPKREVLYKFADDEILAANSLLTYGFKNCVPMTDASVATSQGMAQRRQVIILDASKLPAAVEQLEQMLGVLDGSD